MKVFCNFAIIIFLLSACQNEQKQHRTGPETNTETLTPEDRAYRETVAIHDEVMPKMGKLIGYKKTLAAKIDSLEGVLQQKTITKHACQKKGTNACWHRPRRLKKV